MYSSLKEQLQKKSTLISESVYNNMINQRYDSTNVMNVSVTILKG